MASQERYKTVGEFNSDKLSGGYYSAVKFYFAEAFIGSAGESRRNVYVTASLFDNDKLLLREKMDATTHSLTLHHPRRVPNQFECVDHVRGGVAYISQISGYKNDNIRKQLTELEINAKNIQF